MEAPVPTAMNQEITEKLYIEQDNIKYLLTLNAIGDIISFNLEYNSNNYVKKIPLKDIKDKESKQVFLQFSSKDFIDYLKTYSDMKKISLIKKDNKVLIKFVVELLLKKHEVEIELSSKDSNLEVVEAELKELKINYNILKQENKELKERIEKLENEVNEMKNMMNFNINKIKMGNKSVIMKENEFDMIHLAIKSRLNKEVKELKKLYQATIDGDGAINFHSRCDNIPNTLVLIKSAGNRRFGGFTTQKWDSSEEFKVDPNSFVFSLDKQKIYSQRSNGGIWNGKDCGPLFGNKNVVNDLYINKHGIQEKGLYTYESYSDCGYNYNGDKNALSESGNAQPIYASEYEVFQVIF